MAETTEITKVQIIIRKFLHETKDVVKDAGKSQKWLESFRNTLQYQDLEEFPNEFAMEILREAKAFNELQRKNAQFKQVRKILAENGVNNPTRSQIEHKWAEIYGDAATSDGAEIRKDTDPRVKELFNSSKDRMDTEYQRKHDWYEKKKMAGAPTREDGEFKSGSGNAVNLESATPAKPSLAYAGKNGLVRLTDDEYALLLQELGNKRKADRLIDDLDYKLAEGATISQDASTSNGEDDSKVPPSCTVSSKEPVVLNLAYSGEFGNVTLTQEQYNSLLQKFGNKTACDRAIDSLSAKLENGELKARSHYAVLVKWANYRNDKADERNDDGETYLEKNWRKALNNVGMDL